MICWLKVVIELVDIRFIGSILIFGSLVSVVCVWVMLCVGMMICVFVCVRWMVVI